MSTETTRWMFYHKGVYGPAEERELREFSDSFQHLSCELGVCSVVMRQMWDEIDRLRAELEPRPKIYAPCIVSSTDA